MLRDINFLLSGNRDRALLRIVLALLFLLVINGSVHARKMKNENQDIAPKKIGLLGGIGLMRAVLLISSPIEAHGQDDKIEITPNFTDKEFAPNEKIELILTRDLSASEGRFAVFFERNRHDHAFRY